MGARPAKQDIRRIDPETGQLVEREIDAAHFGILCHVSQNVGELHGDAELRGVRERPLLLAAENWCDDQSDSSRHLIAVPTQIFPVLVSTDGEVIAQPIE